MKNQFIKLFLLFASVIYLAACNSNTGNVVVIYDTIDSSTIKADTMAFLTRDITYKGILPCADCSGILTELSLNTGSLTYLLKRIYQGKKGADSLQLENGKLYIEKDSVNTAIPPVYKLISEDKKDISYFQVMADSGLRLLDNQKKNIESGMNLTLVRVKDEANN